MVQRSALPLSTGKNYKVVTLCGSPRFKEQYMEVQKRLTLEGCIVISVGLFGHSGDEEVWNFICFLPLYIIANIVVCFI